MAASGHFEISQVYISQAGHGGIDEKIVCELD